MKILNELWNGDVLPREKSFHNDPEYRKSAHDLLELDKRLRRALSPEQTEILDEMQNAECELSALTQRDMFYYAFCMGAGLILDVLEGAG